ncbi:MAG: hypothetical protein HY541_00410 [Deltaproteobacteria bacterium]|nr:hypothetical protein [Deltaproteobacteria bacterium]
MKRLIYILLFSFSCLGFVSCNGNTAADPDEETPAGDDGNTPDENPSIDEEGPSDTDADDGIADGDEDIDIDMPDIDEGDDEAEEEVVTVSPEIVSFEAGEECVKPDTRVTLSWETENADAVYLGSTEVSASGEKNVRPFFETTYTLTAVNGSETTSRTVSIYFKEASTAYQTTEETFDAGGIDLLSSSGDGTLLILSNGKVYKGSFGEDFVRLTPNSSVSQWSVLAIDPVDSDIIYAGTTGRIYRSSNGGESWPDVIPVRRNNVDLAINTVYSSPADPEMVYIGFEGGGFVLDAERGTLDLISDLNTESIRRFASDADCVVAATKSDLFVSFNEGDSWSETDAANWGEIHSIDIFDGTLYVSAEKGLYSVSIDSISDPSWEKMEGLDGPVYQILVREEALFPEGIRGLAHFTVFSPFQTGVVYAATGEGIYRGLGDEWERVSAEEAHWIFDDGDPVAVSDSALTAIDRTIVYSNDCPNQPSAHTISAGPLKFPL